MAPNRLGRSACLLLLFSQLLFVAAGILSDDALSKALQGGCGSVALSLMQKSAGVLPDDVLSKALRLDDEEYMADEPWQGGSVALSLMQTRGKKPRPLTAAQRATAAAEDAHPAAPLPLAHVVSDAVASANASLEVNSPDTGSLTAAQLGTAAAVDAQPVTASAAAESPHPPPERLQEVWATPPSSSYPATIEVASAPLVPNSSHEANPSGLPVLSMQTNAERIPVLSLVEVDSANSSRTSSSHTNLFTPTFGAPVAPPRRLADLLKGAFLEYPEAFKSQGVQASACALLLFALTWIGFWWFGRVSESQIPARSYDDDPLGYLFKAKRMQYLREATPNVNIQGRSRQQ